MMISRKNRSEENSTRIPPGIWGCRLLLGFLALALIQGCAAVGPDYTLPKPSVPDAWHQELVKGLNQGEPVLETWWTLLEDPVLNSLIERASEDNISLQVALARIKEARARLGIATGDIYPDLKGAGDAIRKRSSDEFSSPLGDNPDTFYNLGLSTGWELDFWGRVRRSVESSQAGLQASVENYRDALVLLYSDIALNYVNIRTLQARIHFARANATTQQQTLEVTMNRLEAELAPELDKHQATMNLEITRSVIPSLKILLNQAIHRLGVLVGKPPGALYEELSREKAIPQPSKTILVGLPANLLRQRPDIRQAERELAAQSARIGVARADLYPTFSLTGSLGYEGTTDLFESSSRFFTFGPTFRWNIFNAGQVRNRIKVEDARTEQALKAYELTILTAMEEVENAMVAYAQEMKRAEAILRSVASAQKSVDLVSEAYRIGVANFQNVLDLERTLFQQQDALADSQGKVVQNLIRIYKALGGGWTPPAPEKK